MKKPDLKPDSQSIQRSFQTRAFQVGGYSVAAALVVIAIAVAVNLVVGAIPSNYTKLDMTESGLFTLSEQTEKVVSGLEEDVTVYWLVQTGNEDSYVKNMLDQYDSLSSALVVEKVDPVVYPNFAEQYTEDTVYENSLIVVSGEQSTFVSYYDIYETDYTNYYVDGSVSYSFAGEGAITSAVDYVSSEDLPVIYITSGHGEASLDSTVSSSIDKENYLTEEISLITETAVPEDCDLLMIHSPQSDISTEEADMIIDYLQAGGNLLLVTDYTETSMPNLARVMAEYGVEAAEGIVIDQDASYNVQGYSYMLLPDINSHDITTPSLTGATTP